MMSKKEMDWANIGFGYVQTEQRYVSNYKDGTWDEGGLTTCLLYTSSSHLWCDALQKANQL